VIISNDQIRSRVEALYVSGGLPRGQSTGWPSVDHLYTVGMNQWTLVTGTPNSGKSEWLDALMVNLAKSDEWKFFIYSPENHPLELHHSKVLEKYIGKPFDNGPTERMTQEEMGKGEDWMRDKFYFCKPDSPDIESILIEGIDKLGSVAKNWKTGIVIDPWNYLEHYRPAGQSETEYVSDVLSRVIRHVREHYCHLFLVAHPAKMQKNRDGSYPIPGPRDISGSAHFWNKADNSITIHRDQQAGTNEVEVHVQKVRFKHIGRIGECKLLYNRATGQYREVIQAVPQRKAIAGIDI